MACALGVRAEPAWSQETAWRHEQNVSGSIADQTGPRPVGDDVAVETATLDRTARSVRTARLLPPPGPAMAAARQTGRSSPSSAWIASRVTVVVGLFLAIVFAQRMWTPQRGTQAANLVQVCGKVPLDSKQYLHLVRIGERLLVLLQSPQGVQRVTEITDAAEVTRMLDRLAPAGRSRSDRAAQWLLAQSRPAETQRSDSGKDEWR